MDASSLESVSAQELAVYLYQRRFEGDAQVTSDYLKTALASVPGTESTNDTTNNSTSTSSTLGRQYFETPATSACQPRATFTVSLHENGLFFTDKKSQSFTISVIQTMLIIPKPQDCRTKAKRPAYIMILHHPNQPIVYKNKSYSQIGFTVWTTPFPAKNNHDTTNTGNNTTHDDHDEPPTTNVTQSWITALARSLHYTDQPVRVFAPHVPNNNRQKQTNVFTSYSDARTSSTTAGLPFVPCYYGVKDGVLFPVSAGLLFMSNTPMFWPRSQLKSIHTTTTNRYLTLSVSLESDDNDDDDTTTNIDFTNIIKDEQQALDAYIHQVLIPAMQADADDDDNAPTSRKRKAVDDDDDDDDESEGAEYMANSGTSSEEEDEDDNDEDHTGSDTESDDE